MVKFMKKQKNIAVGITTPKDSCEDKKCPFHGQINVRGRSFVGKVIKFAFQKNALIEWERKAYIPKYERYEKRRSRVWAHCPKCLGIALGDMVQIMETRKLSKTKNFVVVKKS